MKALVVTAPNQPAVQEIPEPRPGRYDALVRIEACGICNSTDWKLIEGTMSWAPPFPIVLGHESVGIVTEVGPGVRKFKVGDRVSRPLAFWPGSEPGLNVAMGGFAERGMVRDGAAMAADGDESLAEDYNVQRQIVLPPNLDAVTGALAISLSETASMLRHLPNLRGKKIVVAGTGIAGLAFTLWAKLAGAFVITLGRRASRLEEAKKTGADATVDTTRDNFPKEILQIAAGPVDGMIEATGDAALAGRLLEALSEQGFAAAYGVPPTGTSYDPLWKSHPVEEHLSFPWVADLLARGWIRPDWFISHTWPFEEVLDAFEQAHRGDVRKGFVKIGGAS